MMTVPVAIHTTPSANMRRTNPMLAYRIENALERSMGVDFSLAWWAVGAASIVAGLYAISVGETDILLVDSGSMNCSICCRW